MTKDSLVKMLEKRVKSAGSAYKVAAALDITDSHLSDVLSGRRDPGPSMLKALKLERVVTYRTAAAK